jgi:fermentation-respiration switch protein FrsA (DUF1100 family)
MAVLAALGMLAAGLLSRHDVGMFDWIVRSLLYFPTHAVAHPLAAFGADAEDVWFGEHARLHGVYLPPPTNGTGGTGGAGGTGLTLVIFHGNGGNVSHRAPLLARMRRELRAGLFIFDYQGYGLSSGRPSEAATRADARAALAYLRSRPDVDADRLVYYGESLGGAVAVTLATEAPPVALIVQSSFTSIAEMTATHYPLLRGLLPLAPVSYDSLAAVPRLRVPLLVIHGGADTLISPDHGQRLYDAAHEPKRLVIVPDAGHNDVHVRGGPELWEAMRDFLGSLAGAPRG